MAKRILNILIIAVVFAISGFGAGLTDSLKPGKAELKSASALAFGPEGILFVGDWLSASIYAMDTGDRTPLFGAVDVEGIDRKIAAMLGTTAEYILINDIAVNPMSGKVYLSISRSRGPEGLPVILRVDSRGNIEQLSLTKIKHSKVELRNVPENRLNPRESAPGLTRDLVWVLPKPSQNHRLQVFMDLAYVDGKLYVAGMSNEEFESKLRTISFPFTQADNGTSIEIYHSSHGRFETEAPIRTFVPYQINNVPYFLASYGCTPLVKIPVSSLQANTKLTGTTIAELGAHNVPMDMIVYKKGGTDYLLMASNLRGLLKINLAEVGKYQPITSAVPETETAGLPHEVVKDVTGVVHLEKLDDRNAVVLTLAAAGSYDLRTIALP